MTGPLILITLGLLFLLNNLDPLTFDFGRMWPVILIVIGLVKIFEYFSGAGRSRRARLGHFQERMAAHHSRMATHHSRMADRHAARTGTTDADDAEPREE